MVPATGVKLKFQFGGTMESTEAVLNGDQRRCRLVRQRQNLLSSPQGQAA